MIQLRPLRPLLRVTLPVALAAVFVCLDSAGESDTNNESSPYESIPDESQPDPAETVGGGMRLTLMLGEREQ